MLTWIWEVLLREWLEMRTKAARVYLSPCCQPRSHRPRRLDLRFGRFGQAKTGRGLALAGGNEERRGGDGRSWNVSVVVV